MNDMIKTSISLMMIMHTSCGYQNGLIYHEMGCAYNDSIKDEGKDCLVYKLFMNHTYQNMNSSNITWIRNTTNSNLSRTFEEILEASQSLMNYIIGDIINTYYFPVLVPIGVIGNCLSAIVMSRPHNRKVSFSIYMLSLSVSDNIMLFIASYYWVVTVPLLNSKVYSQSECKFWVYLYSVTSTYGVFTILAMTCDRFLALRFPLKSHIICTPKRTKCILFLLLLTIATFNIPYYIYSAIFNNKYCVAFLHRNRFIDIYLPISMLLSFCIPFIALLIMNILIIITVRNRVKKIKINEESNSCQETASLKMKDFNSKMHCRDQEQDMDSVDTRAAHADRRKKPRQKRIQEQLVVILLLVSFTFLLLTLPLYVRYGIYMKGQHWTDPQRYMCVCVSFKICNSCNFRYN